MYQIEPSRICEIAALGKQWRIGSISPGPHDEVVLTLVSQVDTTAGDPQERIKASAHRGYQYRIVSGDGEISPIHLPESRFVHVQPCGRDELFYVDGRARPGEPNAAVVSRSGKRAAAFHVGDGIQDVRVTADGKIWISYFDEGVFGSTVGRSGLARFGRDGTCEFKFNDLAVAEGKPDISDCYALNTSKEGVYLYYYTDFPLAQVKNDQIEMVRYVPLSGARAFAVLDGSLLLWGSYKGRSLSYISKHNDEVTEIRAVDSSGATLEITAAAGTGAILYMADGRSLHSFNLAQM